MPRRAVALLALLLAVIAAAGTAARGPAGVPAGCERGCVTAAVADLPQACLQAPGCAGGGALAGVTLVALAGAAVAVARPAAGVPLRLRTARARAPGRWLDGGIDRPPRAVR